MKLTYKHPDVAQVALMVMRGEVQEDWLAEHQLKQTNLLPVVNQVRLIFSHPCPQNRTTDAFEIEDPDQVYYTAPNGEIRSEQKGLLGLTAKNDNNTAVTKEAVLDYINELIAEEIKFHEQRKNFCRDLVCDKLGIKLSHAKVTACVAKGTNNRAYTDIVITKLFSTSTKLITEQLIYDLYAHKVPLYFWLVLLTLEQDGICLSEAQYVILTKQPDRVKRLYQALLVFEENKIMLSQTVFNRLFEKNGNEYIIAKSYCLFEKIDFPSEPENRDFFIDKIINRYFPAGYLEALEKLWQEKISLTPAMTDRLFSCTFANIAVDILIDYQKKTKSLLSVWACEAIIHYYAEHERNKPDCYELILGLDELLKNNIAFSPFIYDLIINFEKQAEKQDFDIIPVICKAVAILYQWELPEHIITQIFANHSLITARVFLKMHKQDPAIVPRQELIDHLCQYVAAPQVPYFSYKELATTMLVLCKYTDQIDYQLFELIIDEVLKSEVILEQQQVLKIVKAQLPIGSFIKTNIKEWSQKFPNLLHFKPAQKEDDQNNNQVECRIL